MKRALVPLAIALTLGSACAERPDPKCQTPEGCAADEFCAYSEAYGFLEDGNPSLFNSDSYACKPLPARCTESSCACLTCADDFACDAGPSCTCVVPALCTDTDEGAIVGTFKE